MSDAWLRTGTLRREMLRILYNAGMVSELDESLITVLVSEDDSVRLVFENQFVHLTPHDRELSLNVVSEKIRSSIVLISKFQSALAQNVSALHGV